MKTLDCPALRQFNSVWLVDTEYTPRDGYWVDPVCLSAKEWRSGSWANLWVDELGARPPYRLDSESLVVAYSAPAEFSFHLSWGWPLPKYTIDLHTEYKASRNGLKKYAHKDAFIHALDDHGIPNIGAAMKESEQNPARRGAPFSDDERQALQRYCRSDVEALEALWEAMLPTLDIPHALERGVFSKVAACVEYEGIPMDIEILNRFEHRSELLLGLVKSVDQPFGVFDGISFRRKAFSRLLETRGMEWPHSKDGIPLLDKHTFARMGQLYPEIQSIGRLRYTMSKIRTLKLTVGPDGRNRTAVRPFSTTSSRNAPSTTKFIFGASRWMRALIKPPRGYALVHADWTGQDFGSCAALSQDPLLMEDYLRGDPYENQARRLGWIPADASEETVRSLRDRFKISALSIFYGLQARSLSGQMNISVERAGELLTHHRETYEKYWAWSDGQLIKAKRKGVMRTSYGWHRYLEEQEMRSNHFDFSLRNHLVQTVGAQMLRIMTELALERGFHLCGLIHDALVVVVPIETAEQATEEIRELMIRASSIVLGGFKLRSDCTAIKFPDRYPLKRQEEKEMFEWVRTELEKISILQTGPERGLILKGG